MPFHVYLTCPCYLALASRRGNPIRPFERTLYHLRATLHLSGSVGRDDARMIRQDLQRWVEQAKCAGYVMNGFVIAVGAVNTAPSPLG